MYYYSKKSSKKVVHTADCFHVRNVEVDGIGWFESLNEAYEAGCRLCKHCSVLFRQYNKEADKIVDYCRKNGLSAVLTDRNIDVYSLGSRWKIAPDKKNRLIIYHKNTFETAKDDRSEIPGFHLQSDARKRTVVGYLRYVVEHDAYRAANPVWVPKKKKEKKPPRKGTKRYKSAQRRLERYERKNKIRNVLQLIDGLYPAMSGEPFAAT